MISPQVPCKDSTQLVEEGEADSVLPVPAAPHELVDVAGLARERLRQREALCLEEVSAVWSAEI